MGHLGYTNQKVYLENSEFFFQLRLCFTAISSACDPRKHDVCMLLLHVVNVAAQIASERGHQSNHYSKGASATILLRNSNF